METTEELEARVIEELNRGNKEFVVYTKDFTKEQLKNINRRLDGYYGYVDSYSIARYPRKGLYQTRFKMNISDNYYAYHHLTEGLNIDEYPRAKELAIRAKQILKKILKKNMTDYEKEKAIHDFIVKNGEYGFLKGKQEPESYHATGILLEGIGVCNAYTEAMQLLLSLAGVESKIVIGVADEDHSWNLVKLDEKWYHVDTTWDDPVPDEKGRVFYNYFNLPDEIMEKTHTWERSRYESANSYEQNYYARRGVLCKNYEETKEKIWTAVSKRQKKVELLLTGNQAKEYSYNFILKNKKIRRIKWRTKGESPSLVLEMTLSYYKE